MSTEIYYFSGTGNSLYVARELQKRLPESSLIPIIHLLHNGPIRTGADTVGLVFPNFCLTIPIPVHDFLARADLRSAKYLFAICTRGGTPADEAYAYINDLLKRQGKRLDAQLSINMPWNHPVGKENLTGTATQEEIARLETAMLARLDEFSPFVLAQKAYFQEDTDALYKLPAWLHMFEWLVSRRLNYVLHDYMYQKLVILYSDAQCTGCGVCEQVCLSGKISLVDKRSVWSRDTRCYACFACINFCPQRAIQVQSRFPIQSSSEVNDRYHHPSVHFREIAQQRKSGYEEAVQRSSEYPSHIEPPTC